MSLGGVCRAAAAAAGADRARRHDPRLLPDPPRAGRPGADDPRQPGDAGAGRAAPPRVGARPPAPVQYEKFMGAARARRPRLDSLFYSVAAGRLVLRAAAGDALADRPRDAALGADRGAARGDRGDAPRPHPRPRRPRGAARRPRLPALLARDRAAARLRAAPRARVPGRRLRRRLRRPPALDVPAGADGRARHRADPDPQPAREPARGARVGLRDDGALEGPAGAPRARPPRASERRRSRPSPCSASTSATWSAARS